MKLLKNDIQMFATGEFEADVFYEYIGSPLIESVKVTIKCPAKLGTTIPSGWTKEDDYTLTRVYTEDSTQLVTLYLYPGSSSGSTVDVDVNINVFGIGKINTHDQKFYAFGENKSKQEVYTKGDYLLLTGTIVIPESSSSYGVKEQLLFDYPEGFNANNTMVVSAMGRYFPSEIDGTKKTAWVTGFGTGSVTADVPSEYKPKATMNSGLPTVELSDNKIRIGAINIWVEEKTFDFRVLLLKIDEIDSEVEE